MDQIQEKDYRNQDFTHSWVSSSGFLFYLQLACIVAFLLGASICLYRSTYKGKPNVEVPGNTLYTPVYK